MFLLSTFLQISLLIRRQWCWWMSHWGDRGCRLPINCPMEIAQFLKTNPGADQRPTNPRSRLPTIYARWQTWRVGRLFRPNIPDATIFWTNVVFFCRRNIRWATKSLSSRFSSLPAKVILSYLSFSSIPADFYRQNCPFLLLDSKPAGSKWCRHTSSNKHLFNTIFITWGETRTSYGMQTHCKWWL